MERPFRLTWEQFALLAVARTLLDGRTLLIAFAGGLLANAVGLPAGWLSGAMMAVTIAAVWGMNVHISPRLADAVFVVLGALLGAGVTPEIIDRVGSWPISLAGLLVSVVAVVIAVQAYLVRVAGWDRTTAFFAAIPGALSYVVALASTTGADLRRVAVSQSIRLFLLVAVIPPLVSAVEAMPTVAAVRSVTEPLALLILLAASLSGGLLFRALRVPAGLLSGALAVSSVAHATGWVSGGLPEPLTVAAYVTLGAMIGCRFFGTSLEFLRKIALASFGAFLIGLVVASASALMVALVVDVPLAQILVAFAPGGLDAMTALALALHLDSAFVAAHQLARFIGIAVFAPFVARWVLREDGKD